MKFIRHARHQAQICRNLIGVSSENLLYRIEKYLWDKYQVELVAVHPSCIEGGRAELRPAESCLLYDERLNAMPDEKLFVIAHELGHLELHERLTRRTGTPDPVYGSMYWNAGASSLTRYNSRSREEAEANAFAAEFLCPVDEVFAQWRSEPQVNSLTLAERLNVPVRVVRMQLAEAIYQMAFGVEPTEGQASRKEFACDASQEAAARRVGGPVLVDAGPGTGKTATLVRRVEYLLRELEVEPESVLVLTFSNDAAAELEQRIAAKFGSPVAARIRISTFHGFGLAFLQHHGQLRDLDASVCVLDEAGQAELVTGILGAVSCVRILKLSRPDETVKEIVRHIGYLKDRLCRPDDLAQVIDEWQAGPDEIDLRELARDFLEVFRAYEKACAERQRVDFADLISLPIEILARQPELKERYCEKYKWVLVDEYQDVSRATAVLLQHLCGNENPPWVVGDKRQSIYRFRGAAPENVDEFARDFPGAVKYSLEVNYRSCSEVVKAANQLAHLMETLPGANDFWRVADSNPLSTGAQPVSVAVADSDQAEHDGIAAQVQAWLEAGVAPRDIVVLARRNIDVRNIALALGRRDPNVTASGLVTAEGAAGDLASVATFIDRPLASLPRLAFALGRGRFDPATINAVIRSLRSELEEAGGLSSEGVVDLPPLAHEIGRVLDCLQDERFSADAFTVMCSFLFDGSDYFRRIVDGSASAERTLALGEIVASLTRAAAYRFTHLGVQPQVSRKGFGKYFRESLSESVPSLMPTRVSVDAVRVMTCHSSKGLEFPCVIVAGQTLSRAPRGYKWLPSALQPRGEDDAEQADSLLFVGATRAQQSLMISYAMTASGLSGARPRDVASLLGRWQESFTPPMSTLPPLPLTRIEAEMGRVWGGSPGHALAVRALDGGQCSLNTYLRDYVGVKFPLNEKPLYPVFYVTLRFVMQSIVEQAHRQRRPVDPGEARELLLKRWAEHQIVGHSHYEIYLNLALTYVERFARAFVPEQGVVEYLNHVIGDDETNFPARLDLVALYRVGSSPTAIMFRPESLREKVRGGGLLWSALGTKYRAAFVLLKRSEPGIQPLVFSGDDGEIYRYQWTTRRVDFESETERILQRFRRFAQGVFIEQVGPFVCDRCESRIACPYWVSALD
jgi:DNA helicase II / ATP-dependent DNA helicase PcrA